MPYGIAFFKGLNLRASRRRKSEDPAVIRPLSICPDCSGIPYLELKIMGMEGLALSRKSSSISIGAGE
jgi:hypothetical protein